MGNPHMANSSQSLTPEARDLARLFGPGVHRARLTDGAEAAGDPPAGARVVDDSPCPPGHNTPLPLERSPPVSFKRLLGATLRIAEIVTSPGLQEHHKNHCECEARVGTK